MREQAGGMDHTEHEQPETHDETIGARPIDPETGHPVEPELDGVSVVPEQDPSPEPSAEEWREAEENAEIE